MKTESQKKRVMNRHVPSDSISKNKEEVGGDGQIRAFSQVSIIASPKVDSNRILRS